MGPFRHLPILNTTAVYCMHIQDDVLYFIYTVYIVYIIGSTTGKSWGGGQRKLD